MSYLLSKCKQAKNKINVKFSFCGCIYFYFLNIADYNPTHHPYGYESNDEAEFNPDTEYYVQERTLPERMKNGALDRQTGERYTVIRRNCRRIASFACGSIPSFSRTDEDSSKLVWTNTKKYQGKDRRIGKLL